MAGWNPTSGQWENGTSSITPTGSTRKTTSGSANTPLIGFDPNNSWWQNNVVNPITSFQNTNQNFIKGIFGQNADYGTTGEDARLAALKKTNASASTLGGTPGETNRFANMQKGEGPGTNMPQQQDQGGGGGGGSYGSSNSSLNDLFDPLFKALDQQRANAESRYSENAGQIKNIFGQLIGARTADIDTIDKAYSRLQEAAASRGAATLEGMQSREATRQSQNAAVLQSMGVGDIGSTANDRAAQASQTAQNVQELNQSNWSGLLSAMGATAQDIARSDITSYGYKQAEDIAALQANKENYLQTLDQQGFDLQAKQAQAEWDYAQAQKAAAASAAAAAANAANKADAAAAKQIADLLKYADPLTQAINRGLQFGTLDANSSKRVQDAYNTWMVERGSSPTAAGVNGWNKVSATGDALKSVGAQLNDNEKRALNEAISNSF